MPTTIDAKGLVCPLPLLRLQKTLGALPSGAEVALWTSDPASVKAVQDFCQQSGHILLSQQEQPGPPKGEIFCHHVVKG